MSPVEQKPIIHGRDHMPGHPDPIPGLLTGPSGSYQELILAEPSLIGYWPLDDPAEPAVDHSGGSRDLTEEDLAPTYSQGGPFTDDPAATAILFNRAGGVLTSTDNLIDGSGYSGFSFAGTASFTYEIIAYPTATETSERYGGIMGCAAGTSAGLYLLFARGAPGDVTRGVIVHRAGGEYASVEALALNTWVHLALTYDGATLRLYFDGEEQFAQATTASHTATGSLRLGSCYTLPGSPDHRQNFRGRLAQAAIYQDALDASTITQHANTRIGGGGMPAGWVPTSDGTGGVTWAAPTIEVEF